MRLAIILLIAVFGLFFGLIVYRCLLHSKRFARLIGGAIEPPLETPTEVLDQYTRAGVHAKECANDCDTKARAAQKDASFIRDRLL